MDDSKIVYGTTKKKKILQAKQKMRESNAMIFSERSNSQEDHKSIEDRSIDAIKKDLRFKTNDEIVEQIRFNKSSQSLVVQNTKIYRAQ